MSPPAPRPPRPAYSSSLLASLLLHLAAVTLLWWGGPRLKAPDVVQVRLVRPAGGGMNRPGWVDNQPVAETPAPASSPADPPVTEAQPPAETRPARPEAREPVVARTPRPVPGKPAAPSREPEPARRESERAVDPAARPGAGGRRDSGAGPRGAGNRTGAVSDQPDVSGMGQYLLRVENAVQRAFKYPARSSKHKAVFHFRVDRQGRVEDLELVQESGLPGLDLAGRSALTRAVFPPLPPAFPYDQIGVTFTFVDE
jgi:outer membrane biosynthesis protein TonB